MSNLFERLNATPIIKNEIYNQFPQFLKTLTDNFTEGRERDSFLTAALGVLSGMFPSIKGRYAAYTYYGNLYAIIAAPAGNGKGIIKFAKLLGMPLHEQTVAGDESQIADGDTSEEAGEEKMENKKFPVLFIPANTSSAMFVHHLKDSDERVIVFEPEIDTLLSAWGQDWGNVSHQYRVGYDHDMISYSRKSNGGSVIEVNKPKLSVILSGTISQVNGLLISTENGLFSRFIFYAFAQDISWNSVKPCEDCPDLAGLMLEAGIALSEFASGIGNVEFKLAGRHWDALDETFATEITDVTSTHGDDAASVVRRAGVAIFRIAMILSIVRHMGEQNVPSEITCEDTDFASAMELGKVYLKHAQVMMELTPKAEAAANCSRLEQFFNKLPDTFGRKDAMNIAETLNIPTDTADKWLKKLKNDGRLKSEQHGQYKKA